MCEQNQKCRVISLKNYIDINYINQRRKNIIPELSLECSKVNIEQ